METFILKTKDYGSVIEQTYYKKQENKISSGNSSTLEEKLRSSRSRAISRIKEICYCNNFDYFFTITLKDIVLRNEPQNAINFLNKSIINYYRRGLYKGEVFKYIYVFEYTKKRGNSFTRLL